MSELLSTDDTAHLWLLWPDRVQDQTLLAAYHGLMTPDEAARQQRYVFPEGRREYLLTRALVRTTLSRYAPVAPRDWVFSANEYGCPAIASPGGTGLSFNLSNTRGLIACLVAREREVGVDAEDMSRATETVSIADHYFSLEEVRELRALAPERQQERFFTYWTLKEAYIKARGMGLAIPLEQFSFRLGERIGVALDPLLADDPASWQFDLFRPSPNHLLATALRVRPGEMLALQVRETVPLQDTQ